MHKNIRVTPIEVLIFKQIITSVHSVFGQKCKKSAKLYMKGAAHLN